MINTKIPNEVLKNSEIIKELDGKKWIERFNGNKPTNPDELSELLKNMPKNSMVYFNDGNEIITCITLEELKEWLSKNYLKLSGGTMTGRLYLNDKAYDNLLGGKTSEILGSLVFGPNTKEPYFYVPVSSFSNTSDEATDQLATFGLGIRVPRGNTFGYANMSLILNKNGSSHCCSPPPRENIYNNDIDTLRASINRHPLLFPTGKTIHIGGDNASDTADLYMGRGFSEDKPFATLSAALNFICSSYSTWYGVIFVLHSDQTLSNYTLVANQLRYIRIQSDTTKRTLTISNNFQLAVGRLILQNLNLVASNTTNLLSLSGSETILDLSTDLNFSGEVINAVLYLANGASAFASQTYTGDIVGKRYLLERCSRLMVYGHGPNAIPGTIAGSADATSVYA